MWREICVVLLGLWAVAATLAAICFARDMLYWQSEAEGTHFYRDEKERDGPQSGDDIQAVPMSRQLVDSGRRVMNKRRRNNARDTGDS